MKIKSKTMAIIITLLAILIIPKVSGQLANLTASLFGTFDPDGAYLWISVHHIFQLILTVLLMLVFKRNLGFWGFNLNNLNKSLVYFKQFVMCSTGFVLLYYVILFFFSATPGPGYALSAENILGQLGFQLFLSGTCEEPLFRGFVMIILYGAFAGSIRFVKTDIPTAGIIAAIFFTVAHIQYSIWPFEITYINPMQLVLSFGLGLYYAVVFYRTRSLLTPILAHGYINFLITGLGFLSAYMAG